MKPMLAGRLVFTAVLTCCVTGCASTLRSLSGHLEPEASARYASMPPEEFVKTRFYTEERNFLDDMNEGLAKLRPERSDERQTSPVMSEDGRQVLFVAYYTDVNYHQLTRPQQNLQAYCEVARRGQWRTVESHENDPFAGAQRDLLRVYNDTESWTREHLRRQNGGSGYAPAEAEIAASTAAIATRDAAALNEMIASLYSVKGFRMAVEEGAFGVFQCSEGTSSTSSWFVSILPKQFYPPRDPSNQLHTATAVLAIRPFRMDL